MNYAINRECQVWGEIGHRLWKVEVEILYPSHGDKGQISVTSDMVKTRGHDVQENITMTKKIFQDDGQRFELGSLGKSGQGLARQGLLGGMGWSWWSRQINLHAMRPKTHKWAPSWS